MLVRLYIVDMNKKTLLTSLLFACLLMSICTQKSLAQQSDFSSSKKGVGEPTWFISFGAGTQTYFGEDDNKVDFHRRLTFAPTFSIGRNMNTWGKLRLQFTGGSLHGFNDGYSGTYTRWTDKKYVNVKDPSWDPQWDRMGWTVGKEIGQTGEGYAPTGLWGESGGFYMQHLRYFAVNLDLSFNILNLFGGYEPNRKVDVSPFGGVGFYQRFAHLGNLAGTYFGGSLGLNISYRVKKNLALYTEARGSITSDEFDAQKGTKSNNGIGSLTFGITYSFGKPIYMEKVDQSASQYSITRVKESGYCGAEFGVVLVPGGNITLNGSPDPVWGNDIPQQSLSVSPFWMDETEVTNLQYREFVCWVRDYVIRQRMAESGDMSYLDWSKPIPWSNPNQFEASVISSVIGGLYGPDRNGIEGLNAAVLNYKYEWFDSKSYYSSFSSRQGGGRSVTVSKDTAYIASNGEVVRTTLTRQSYGNPIDFTNTYIVNIYPDVLSWVDDFPNAKNDQYAKFYFTKQAFDNYPVVGVTWEQAEAFCAWRTQRYLERYGNKDGFEPYRLPTEAEWEFAAKNGNQGDINSMDGTSSMNPYDNNRIAAVAKFMPNRFGLYDMAGNVSEWTSTTYMETATSDPYAGQRATYNDSDLLKRKVFRGGSWKDNVSSYNGPMVRDFEKQYRGRSYIGFRCVRSWSGDNNIR